MEAMVLVDEACSLTVTHISYRANSLCRSYSRISQYEAEYKLSPCFIKYEYS